MTLNLKEDWIILVIACLFLAMAVLFIVILILEIELLTYKLGIYRRRNWYSKNLKKQEKQERKKSILESEKRDKIIREQFFMENYNQWIPEEIEFIIPGFRIEKIKPVD